MTDPSSSPRNRRLDVYVAAVILAGVGALAAAVGAVPLRDLAGGDRPVFVVFCVLLLITELRPMPSLTSSSKITASWTFAFTLIFLAPLGGALLAVGVVSLFVDLQPDGNIKRAAFNAAQFTLSLAVAGLVASQLTDLLAVARGEPITLRWMAGVSVAFAVGFVLNSALISVVIALDQGLPVGEMLRRAIVINLGMDGLLLALAPVFVVIALQAFLLLPFLLLTVWAIFRSASIALANRHEATHDQLTDLPNRRLFEDHARLLLEGAAAADKRAAIIEIDLDGFKGINDRLGHHVGDRVLAEAGERLQTACRSVDHVARLGGDEFAVLLGSVVDRAEAEKVARRFLTALEQPMDIDGVPLAVGASMGVAMFPAHGRDLTTLLYQADMAMYEAKSSQAGVRVYAPSSDADKIGRQSLLSDLSGGIARGELRLAYQPIIEMVTGEINRVECLVRWDHPVRGLVSPDVFIREAEQTELMEGLTDEVLRMALVQCAEWHSRGIRVGIAVNVSARNLHDLRFPNRVAALLAEHNLDAGWLEIEITENTVMQDPVRSSSVLGHLRALGVTLAIDDFGTGYSSLATLRQLTIDRIKIDRSFVTGLAASQGDLTITRSVAELGHNLGLRTVAEGIETPDVLAIARDLGCDEFQGFYASRPVSAVEVTPILAAGRFDIGAALRAANQRTAPAPAPSS